MAKKIWTDEQVKFLIENYEHMKTKDLILALGDKTNDQIRWKAKNYGIHKKVTKSKKDITWLENLDVPDHCYWWGFITADGCFNDKELILSISYSELEHLQIFADKVGSKISNIYRINEWNPNGYNMARVAVGDKYTLPRILKRFSIESQKTYNPFNIQEFITPYRLKYFITGLIDGDGCVEKTGKSICIKVHPNWKSNFDILSTSMLKFYGVKSSVSIGTTGWLKLVISIKSARLLKKLIVDEDIPYMKRKWNRIKI